MNENDTVIVTSDKKDEYRTVECICQSLALNIPFVNVHYEAFSVLDNFDIEAYPRLKTGDIPMHSRL